jgi:anti-repressor protein
VDEGGLYELIIRSDKPEAVPFRRWVTREVLPAIRRTGRYAAVPATYADALELAARQARALDAAALELEAARPAVEFHEQFVTADGLYKIGDVAKVLALPGMGQNKLFRFLRIQGVLIRSGESRNSPYQRHVEAGRFVIKVTTYPIGEDRTGTSKTTYATPKGLAYIADLVKQYGASA